MTVRESGILLLGFTESQRLKGTHVSPDCPARS